MFISLIFMWLQMQEWLPLRELGAMESLNELEDVLQL